ncbi:MAG: restriction endonuclease subunit S, partial [Candidatus Woesebacteria bacterium]|nr:restriction endonuclease subunit S [Candidatus Woesebacteria bacterium]
GFVGLRDLNAELLPEFVAFTLNLLRAKNDQQAVGAVFRNLTTDQVKAISIPVPPIELQTQFRSFLMQVKAVQQDIEKSKRLLDELSRALTVDAFSSELTTSWRELALAEITAAVTSRDALLRERGAKLASRPSEPAPLTQVVKDSQRPARQWLIAELSEFQRQVLAAFSAYPEQPLLAEDADVFARFCDDENVLELLKDYGPSLNNRIRRTLSQLSSLGLIAKLTLPKQNSQTGERDYLKAFRPLREDEYTKMVDVETLRRALLSGAALVRRSFTVVYDYETSNNAGAGGMFQVAALSDEDDKDRIDLVDQGKHYAALDELASDLARRLGVRADQIDLGE